MSMWVVLALLYALFHAIVPSIDRYILRGSTNAGKIDTMSFSMVRFIFNAAIAIIIASVFFGISIPTNSNFWYHMLTIAVLYAISATSYFYAIKLEEVSKMLPLGQSIAIFLSFTLSILFFAETIIMIDVIGVVCIILGSYMIMARGKKFNLPKKFKISKSTTLIIIWSVTVALFGIAFKQAVGTISPAVVNAFLYSLVAFYFIVLNYTVNRKKMVETLKSIASDKKTIFLTAASSTSAAIGTLSLLTALTMGNASEVLTVSRSTPLFAVLLGGMALKEKHWKTRLVGAILIAVGVYGIYV